MARTTEDLVRGAIETDSSVSVDQYILQASVLTDRVNTQALSRNVTLTSGELRLIETYLAAHFYHLRYPKAEQKRVGKSSTRYQGDKWGKGLEGSYWGQMALSIDYSGALAEITGADTSNRVAAAEWLGTE